MVSSRPRLRPRSFLPPRFVFILSFFHSLVCKGPPLYSSIPNLSLHFCSSGPLWSIWTEAVPEANLLACESGCKWSPAEWEIGMQPYDPILSYCKGKKSQLLFLPVSGAEKRVFGFASAKLLIPGGREGICRDLAEATPGGFGPWIL